MKKSIKLSYWVRYEDRLLVFDNYKVFKGYKMWLSDKGIMYMSGQTYFNIGA